MSVESNFIAKLLETKDWKTVSEKRITGKLFNANYKRVFNFISDFKVNYGDVPSIESVKARFPEFDFTESVPERLDFYCDELRNKVKHNLLVDTFKQVQQDINNLNTDEGIKKLHRLIQKVEAEIILTEACKIGEDTEERFKRYEERKVTGGISGIPIGLLPIDKQLGGVKPLDLITFLGYTGTGKSWLLCICAVAMAKMGYKVLLLTKEMLPSQLIDRIDAIWSGISYSRIKDGQLTPQEEERYIKYLREEAPRYKDRLVVELIEGGVLACGSAIDTHKPDICLIDGGYLMADDSDDDDWKGILDVWRGFKALARNRKVPIIATSQLKGETASLSSVSFAKAIAQEADAVFGLEQDKTDKAEKEIKIVTLKVRDGEWKPPFKMSWDFAEMKHDLLYVEEEKQRTPIKVTTIKRIE